MLKMLLVLCSRTSAIVLVSPLRCWWFSWRILPRSYYYFFTSTINTFETFLLTVRLEKLRITLMSGHPTPLPTCWLLLNSYTSITMICTASRDGPVRLCRLFLIPDNVMFCDPCEKAESYSLPSVFSSVTTWPQLQTEGRLLLHRNQTQTLCAWSCWISSLNFLWNP